MKKTPENIIILQVRTKYYDQMMYSSWDMVRDRRGHVVCGKLTFIAIKK